MSTILLHVWEKVSLYFYRNDFDYRDKSLLDAVLAVPTYWDFDYPNKTQVSLLKPCAKRKLSVQILIVGI